VCLRRHKSNGKSSAGLFRGILRTSIMFFYNIINYIALFLVHWPNYSLGTEQDTQDNTLTTTNTPPAEESYVKESLSNILLDHIDFRRPIVDYKNLNYSKEDDAVDKIPESCIEKFRLWVSTWKGWEGELPSKENGITWEEVEKANTKTGWVKCTEVSQEPILSSINIENASNSTTNETSNIRSTSTVSDFSTTYATTHDELFPYSVSKIPNSNLLMVYVNHSKSYCEKLLIKREPVEFKHDERCIRLKTTPYRERPHK
ncbi:unnamed protein product, partial [Didymodactylos carnosus]